VTGDSRRSTPYSPITTVEDIELTAYPKDLASIQGTSLQLRRPALDDWRTLTVLEDDEPLLFDTTYDQGEREQWIRGRTTRSSLEPTLSSYSSRVVAVLAEHAGNKAETVLRERTGDGKRGQHHPQAVSTQTHS